MRIVVGAILLICLPNFAVAAPTETTCHRAETRSLRFKAASVAEAGLWKRQARARLFELMMGGGKPKSCELDTHVLKREPVPIGGYTLEEISFSALADRKVHAWMAVPNVRRGRVGAVLALHGHGGTGEQIVRGQSLYWYGKALAEMGYVVISPDIGQHELQHQNWSLMGERTWDALRCIDYLVTRPEVDPKRIGVCGLSLGGETTMYVAALDDRIRIADSAGWLTTVANMKQGHCPCWNFTGLEDKFDFADIFACIAPRPLVCELGLKETAPGGFPVEIGKSALEEIRPAYQLYGGAKQLTLDVHPYGHVFVGKHFWNALRQELGTPYPWSMGNAKSTDEALRRGEIARRAFARSLGVFDGWWALRDPETNLYPRRVDQPVWAPNDNAADMLPFLFLTAHYVAPERMEWLNKTLENEQKITNRVGVLPDWYSLKDHAWVNKDVDIHRLIFCAAEYCKDGILPMTEVMGNGPWTPRMLGLLDGIFENAPVITDFGLLPADDTEVNGEILQSLGRVYAMTKDEKYWRWMERIGDAYCREVLPMNHGIPAHRWDFQKHAPLRDVFSLNDHGNEIAGGLAELYIAAKAFHPEKAEEYRKPIAEMFRLLLEKGRNPDGLWYQVLKSSTGEALDRSVPDTWGYALGAAVAFGMASGDDSLKQAAEQALRNIDKPEYLDWAGGADSFADSIEGGIDLLNRFPTPEGFSWMEKVLPIFLAKQQDNGIVEGWYGDGNFARTALMAALYYTQGAHCLPWRSDLVFGAVRTGDILKVSLTAPKGWQGRLIFDTTRHKTNFNLPFNYPRLNEFPEWYTVDREATYLVQIAGKETLVSGSNLLNGLALTLKSGQTLSAKIRRTTPVPDRVSGEHPKERSAPW